jgi:hypothetical protein
MAPRCAPTAASHRRVQPWIRPVSVQGGGVAARTASLVVGTKWNVNATWLANLTVSFPVTDRGLRADAQMLFGVDYAFDW